MVCTPAFWARCSLGRRRMAIATLSLWSGASTSGCSFDAGTTTNFVGCVWQFLIGSAATWMRGWLYWDASLTQLVQMFVWCQYRVVHMALVEAYVNFLGSGYQQKLIEYPLFDLRYFKRCLQRTASNVIGTLDPYFLTEFIVNRLKGAESRDWMASRLALKKAIINRSLVMPEIVDVLANFVGVWPLIVSYLKETGRKGDGDNLVVWSPSFNFVATVLRPCILNFWYMEERYGWVFLSRPARSFEVPCLLHAAWNM